MTATEPPGGAGQPDPGIETERSAEVTTQEGTQISHSEQTGVEWPPESEDPSEGEAAHPERIPDEDPGPGVVGDA